TALLPRLPGAKALGDRRQRHGRLGGHRSRLDLGPRRAELLEGFDLGGVEIDGRRHLRAALREMDISQIEMREGDPLLPQGGGVAHVAHEDQRPRSGRPWSAGTEHGRDLRDGGDVEGDLLGNGERHRGAGERVRGHLVVGDQDPLRGERRHPGLEHLSVDEPVVDAYQSDPRGNGHLIAFRNSSEAWPMALRADSASSAAISPMGSGFWRSEIAFRTMGRFTPVTTSTLRSARNERQSWVGDPPRRSVSKRTPSPRSTLAMASAIRPRESGSAAETATPATFSSGPTTPSAVRMSSSASFPCEAMTTP